jgi:transcriptional regulator with XRE-family HTH domain
VSPFSRFLKLIRLKRGFRQKQLALHLGYEPSYLSALERGEKGPPRDDFIARLIRGLSLNQHEQVELEEALKSSRRQFSIPRSATDSEFQLVHQLVPKLGNLNQLQIQLIQIALSIPAACGDVQNLAMPADNKEGCIM